MISQSKTYLKNILILCRVQSVPVTAITLLVGYMTVSQDIYNLEVLHLIIMGTLGHLGVYAHNDYVDYEYDLKHKDEYKPLIVGVISRRSAFYISLTLIISSLAYGILFIGDIALLAYSLAMFAGIEYNRLSKEYEMAAFYLGIWAMTIVFTGSLVAGLPNEITILVAFITFIHLINMTLIGDLKDMESDEVSIPKSLGCKLSDGDLNVPMKFKKLWMVSNSIEGVAIVALSILEVDTRFTVFIIGIILVTVTIWIIYSIDIIVRQEFSFDVNRFKKQITKRELMIVGSLLIAFIPIAGVENIIVVLIGSFTWGLSWLRLLYGEWFYFP